MIQRAFLPPVLLLFMQSKIAITSNTTIINNLFCLIFLLPSKCSTPLINTILVSPNIFINVLFLANFFFVNMYIPLRERNRYAIAFQSLFSFFQNIKINRPIIPRLDPWTANKINAAVSQFRYSNNWRRVFQYPWITFNHL